MAKSDTQRVMNSIEEAIAATSRYAPDVLRAAARQIETSYWEEEELAIVTAFVMLMYARAERQEKALQKAFGTPVPSHMDSD